MAMIEAMTDNERRKILEGVEKRRANIRTQVQSVCQGYTSAMFLYGPGGLGKSHIVLNELDAMVGKGWVHHVGFTTPKALFLALMAAPDSVHCFEDCEELYKQTVAAGILRAACGEPRGKPRKIEYKTAHEELKVTFNGSVIIVSNENLSRSKGVLAAVASRFKPIKWDLTTGERIACILEISDTPWERNGRTVVAKDCRKVADYLIEQMTGGQAITGVDLRTYVEHALPAFAQWSAGTKEVDWRDVLLSKLEGEVHLPNGRDTRNVRLRELALQVDGLDLNIAGKHDYWTERTGLGKSQYHVHLKEGKHAQGVGK